MVKTKTNYRGFTLIELLIVIGIIGFLAAAILVAVDPVKRIQSARDAKRWSEVNAVLNAILNKQVDDRATYGGSTHYPIISSDTYGQIIIDIPADTIGVPTTCVGLAASNCTNKTFNNAAGAADCYVNLGYTGGTNPLIPNYLAAVPEDPNGGTTNNTKYYLEKYSSGRLEIGACAPEQTATISVKR